MSDRGIYVIQRYAHPGWLSLKDRQGIVIWYYRRCDAQIALRALPRGRYRIAKIRD